MSTRGAFGFRIDGQDKITYNHFDSYPGGLGVNILSDIKEYMVTFDSYDAMSQNLQRQVRALRLVQSKDQPSDEDFERYRKYAGSGLPQDNDWQSLLNAAPNTLGTYLNGTQDVIIDHAAFMLDSVFCEWAYVLNVDEVCLEIYKGFNDRCLETHGRYAALSATWRGENPEYFGVTLLNSFPLISIYDGTVTLNTMSRQQQYANQRGMFNSAWMLAQHGAKQFGGKPSDYWIEALKEVQ